MSDDPLRKGRPPKDDDEWLILWTAAQRTERLWPIMKPVVAAFENRVAFAIMLAFVVWMNKDGIIALVNRIAEAGL